MDNPILKLPGIRFDMQRALRAENFFTNHLTYIEGERAGQPFLLEAWQRRIVHDLFGTVRADGTRQYRIGYGEIPRKNGKTTFAAGIALYLLLCDNEHRPQVYSCAGDRSQASIVLNIAKNMVKHGSEILQNKAKSRQYKIEAVANDGWYEACSAEAYSAHGLNPHGIIFDELHVQPNRMLWDAMLSGRGARKQPLVFAITTAGHDRSSICWEMHERAERAIADPCSDPTFYAVIYGAAMTDDWTSEEVWRNANPNLGVSVSLDFLREECDSAKKNPAAQNTFRNLYLNQWTEQAIRWIPVEEWDECKDDLTIDDFVGESCWCGLDLAATRDINSFTMVFQRDDKLHVFPFFWMPEDPVSNNAKNDRRQAKNWAEMGLIKQTPGNVTDYATIADDIAELCQRFFVEQIAYDPWGPARALGQMLVAKGVYQNVIVEYPQSMGNFAAPCKEFERRVASRLIAHNGCPVLRWMIGNTAVIRDSNDNTRPAKDKSSDKIDGVVSTLMAMGLMLKRENDSVYNSEGSLSL